MTIFFWRPIIYALMRNKVVIIYASCGEGHKRAAEGLSHSLGCPAYDLLDFAPRLIAESYSWGYRYVVKNFPLLWVWFFETTKWRLARRSLIFIHRILFRRFMRFILRGDFQVVISTHFFAPPLLTKVKRRRKFANTVLITDLDVHPLWTDEGIDTYFVAIEETGTKLLKRRIPQDRVVVSGIPLRDGFYQPQDSESLRRKFYSSGKPCLLFFSSDTGKIPFLTSVLRDLEKKYTVLVIYGKNRRLKSSLERNSFHSVRGFSYYERIWEMMSGCVALVTKPGGLTVCEALHLRKPLIFTHYIWGQEKKNMDILIAKGVAFYAPDPDSLLSTVRFIDEHYQQIQEKFSRTMNNAHHKIAEYVSAYGKE